MEEQILLQAEKGRIFNMLHVIVIDGMIQSKKKLSGHHNCNFFIIALLMCNN